MAYSTRSDLEKYIPPADVAALTDDANGTTTNDSIVNARIASADAEINTYLRGKHTIPINPIPEEINRASTVIAARNLYRRRLNLAIPQTLEDEYNDVIKGLEQIRDNQLIIDDSGSVANLATFYKSNKTSDSRIFTQNDNESGILDAFFSKSRITPW